MTESFITKLLYIIQYLNYVSRLWRHYNIYRTLAIDNYNRRLLRYVQYLNSRHESPLDIYLGKLILHIDTNNFLQVSEYPQTPLLSEQMQRIRSSVCDIYSELLQEITDTEEVPIPVSF